MKSAKRILALAAAVVILGLYVITFFLGVFGSPNTKNWLMASVVMTVVVPVLIYAMFLVMIGWYIFSFNEISGGLGYLTAMFGSGGRFLAGGSIYLLYSNGILLAALIIGSTNLPQRIAGRILSAVRESDTVSVLLRSLFYAAVFLLSVASLVGASYNPFLYFRF